MREKIGKETGMMRRQQVGSTKALRWALLWILLGVKMQTVEALEEEIPAHQETDCMLVTDGEKENTGKKKKQPVKGLEDL